MLDFSIKPSDVKRPLCGTPWRNGEKETIASNILALAKLAKGNEWNPFTWEDYIAFCEHAVTSGELAILKNFSETGYLTRDTASGFFHFTRKIIGVYMQYCD